MEKGTFTREELDEYNAEALKFFNDICLIRCQVIIKKFILTF